MASVVVVAEAPVLEAVVVAFGGADDVSVLTFPQPVTPSIAAVISREAIVLVISILFIVSPPFAFLAIIISYILFGVNANGN